MKKIFCNLKNFVFVILLSFNSCISDEFDFKNSNIITEITIGGDSLSFPIGKTKPIYLGGFMDSIDNIVKSEDGKYSFTFNYAIKKQFKAFDPITINIPKVPLNPINTNTVELKFPDLIFNPISFESTVSIPKVDIGGIVLPKIATVFTKEITISPTAKSPISNTNQKRSSQFVIPVGPYQLSANDKFDVASQFSFPAELKKVNFILLKNNVVHLRIDKSEINKLGFATQNDIIKSFRIDFPAEFRLTENMGVGSRIAGSSFIIENAPLTASVDVYEASFKIERMDFSNLPQLGFLNYLASVPYSFLYEFNGTNDISNNIIGKKFVLGFSISSEPEVSDIEIVTNEILLPVQSGSNQINQVVDNLPKELAELNTISFEDGASLNLDIQDPNIAPFDFNNGNCIISLPKAFIFKSYAGLNPNTNILTIPYGELFGKKIIGISGVRINKAIVDQKFIFSDYLGYNLNNLTIASETLMLSALQNTSDKNTKVTGSTTGLKIKNASVVTNKIIFNVPDQTTTIDFNELISSDIQKLYSINLKNPAEIVFKINIKNLPPAIDSIFFVNYTIKLPSFMKFEEGNVNSQNEIVLNRGFDVKEGFVKKLKLLGLDFGANGFELKNGYVNFHETITLTGQAFVKSTSLNSDEVSTVQIIQSVDIEPLVISSISAKLGLKIDPISQIIPFNLGALSAGDNNYDIDNPLFTIEIGNSYGIPVDLTMNIIPKRNGVAIPNSDVNTTISVAAADTIGKLKWSRFWLNKTGLGFSQGYTPKAIPALSKLLSSNPDEIEFNVLPTIKGEKHIIDLYSPLNELDLNVSAIVPISFGKDFKISMKDTVAGLLKDLTEFTKLKMIQGVEIVAIIENKIPLDFNLNFAPLDANKKLISGISVNNGAKIKSCNIDGSAQKSIISLGLKETIPGAFALIDGFDFTVGAAANSTVAGLSLKSDQFLTIELRVRIPQGITLNKK